MGLVAGIDNGTQSTKVVIYDYDKKEIVAKGQAAHELLADDDGTREQKAEWWITALKEAFTQIDKNILQKVEAIGVSGQQHGFVPVSKEGNVLYNVKLWCDTATTAEVEEILEAYGGENKLLKEVGTQMVTGFTAPKILWLKKNKPELYKKMETILLPHDYLNYYLTGELFMEYGDASGTALLNVRKREWDSKLLKIIDSDRDLLKALPKLIESNKIGGYVTKKASDEFGIPSGIPVSSGGGDNMMSAIGTGVISNGSIAVSMGTSGTMFGYSDKPVIDPGQRLAPFCSSTGGWMPLLCTMNCTVATVLYRDLFEKGVKQFDDIASMANPGCDGIVTVPYFNGERTPNLPNGKGCLVGMTSSNVCQKNIFRSALESALYGMKMGLEAFQEQGFEAKSLFLVGGGSNSPVWRQIAADILEIPVSLPATSETGAYGGAIQALWALKSKEDSSLQIAEVMKKYGIESDSETIEPISGNFDAYRAAYKTYKEYVSTLSPIFK